MFSRISTVSCFLLFALLAVATPAPEGATNQCNTGSISCCESTHSAYDSAVSRYLEEFGISADSVTGQVGLTCSPLSVVGIGSGSSCNQEPVCCTNNSFNGVINIGCSPININL